MGRKRSRDRGRSSGGVSRRALLGILLAGGAGAAGIQETGAFSSVTGDRQFSVQTAEDSDALLGVQPREATGDDGESVSLFTLTNRFDGPLTLDRVSVVSSGGLGIGRGDITVSSQAFDSGEQTLDPGEQADIEATLSCGSAVTDGVTVEISASSPSESIELTRSTTATCETSGGACLTGTDIEREDETIPCIDIGVRGRKTNVSIDLSNVTVTGSVRVEVRGAGNSEIEIDIENTTIRGDLIVDVRGKGGADIEIELEGNAIEGTVEVPGHDDDDDDEDDDDDDDDGGDDD